MRRRRSSSWGLSGTAALAHPSTWATPELLGHVYDPSIGGGLYPCVRGWRNLARRDLPPWAPTRTSSIGPPGKPAGPANGEPHSVTLEPSHPERLHAVEKDLVVVATRSILGVIAPVVDDRSVPVPTPWGEQPPERSRSAGEVGYEPGWHRDLLTVVKYESEVGRVKNPRLSVGQRRNGNRRRKAGDLGAREFSQGPLVLHLLRWGCGNDRQTSRTELRARHRAAILRRVAGELNDERPGTPARSTRRRRQAGCSAVAGQSAQAKAAEESPQLSFPVLRALTIRPDRTPP